MGDDVSGDDGSGDVTGDRPLSSSSLDINFEKNPVTESIIESSFSSLEDTLNLRRLRLSQSPSPSDEH